MRKGLPLGVSPSPPSKISVHPSLAQNRHSLAGVPTKVSAMTRRTCCLGNGPGNASSIHRFHASKQGPINAAPTAKCAIRRFHLVSGAVRILTFGPSSPQTFGNASNGDEVAVDGK